MLKRFDPAFADKQKRADAPRGFLGDFEHKKLSTPVLFWEKTTEVTKQDREILASGQATEELSVVCKPFPDGGDDPITLPPDAVLIPLFERLKKCKDKGFEGRLVFQVKVLDVAGEKIGLWRFDLDFSKAAVSGYYEAVKSMFLDYLTCKELAGEKLDSYLSFTYKELLECLRTPEQIPADSQGWQRAANRLTMGRAKNGFWNDNKKRFDNSHVVSRVVERFKREPTGSDLMKLYEKLYRVPMSGTKENLAVGGGAQ